MSDMVWVKLVVGIYVDGYGCEPLSEENAT